MSWTPILDEARAAQARALVADVARALSAIDAPADLANGHAGFAIFYDALSTLDPEASDQAEAASDRALEATAQVTSRAAFYHGFPGVAWSLDHRAARRGEDLELDDEDQIEGAVLGLLERPGWTSYDVIGGIVGLGLFALERGGRPKARRAVEAAVARLDELSEPKPEGRAWFTKPEWLPESVRKDYPRGSYNLGVAHGAPSALAFLAAAARRSDRALRLFDEGLGWLLAQRLPDGRFPGYIEPGVAPSPMRLAWCYGEPGIACVLAAAARALERPALLDTARAIARDAIALPDRAANVFDAGLCHGAAGLLHQYNRLYQATGDPAIRGAALRWFDEISRFRTEGGVAGFRSRGVLDGQVRYEDDPGIITGAAGIGLATLAALGVEPTWDRMMLLSLP